MDETAQPNWLHVSSLALNTVGFTGIFLSLSKESITDLECISGNTDINYVKLSNRSMCS